jgi:predicted SprT family Zn-dependent metalloprotease
MSERVFHGTVSTGRLRLIQSLEQITPRTFKGASKPHENFDGRGARTGFNLLHKAAIDIGPFRELFLRHLGGIA